jgi:hypothetical protein
MHITLVDDSIPFDGFSPVNRPLGGAEKAFASLAGALVRRGHEVHVYNRAHYSMVIEGAHWETLNKPFPNQTDALIAFRKPSLLSSVRMAGKRLLWVTAPGHQLEPARKAIEGFNPIVVFQGRGQAQGWKGSEGVELRMIPPGVRGDFTADLPQQLAEVPTAVATTHPNHDMDWLVGLWRGRIRLGAPTARLVVVSSVLAKGRDGGEIPENIRPILERVLSCAEDGVEIMAPTGDPGMAALYRSARVHLYPGHADDMVCWTLADSQACGLPAVARDLGAVRERIVDGQSGQVVPDADAFASVAARLLTDDETFWGMSRDAALLQRGRSWDAVAAEFDTLLAKS